MLARAKSAASGSGWAAVRALSRVIPVPIGGSAFVFASTRSATRQETPSAGQGDQTTSCEPSRGSDSGHRKGEVGDDDVDLARHMRTETDITDSVLTPIATRTLSTTPQEPPGMQTLDGFYRENAENESSNEDAAEVDAVPVGIRTQTLRAEDFPDPALFLGPDVASQRRSLTLDGQRGESSSSERSGSSSSEEEESAVQVPARTQTLRPEDFPDPSSFLSRQRATRSHTDPASFLDPQIATQSRSFTFDGLPASSSSVLPRAEERRSTPRSSGARQGRTRRSFPPPSDYLTNAELRLLMRDVK